jgi:chemotaxis protein methyltransferase WspC
METLRVLTLLEYSQILKYSKEELAELIELLVVPETWFFRDPEIFKHLLSYLQKLRKENPHLHLRLLSVPCSSGEEPYSLAITLLEAGFTDQSFTIDAVDISHNAILKCHKGLYTANSFRSNPPVNLSKYFHITDNMYHINSQIKKCIHFSQENILNESFQKKKPYDIIFCRNLIIYLTLAVQNKLAHTLDTLLKEDGILFVASVEADSLIKKGYKMPFRDLPFLLNKKGPVAPLVEVIDNTIKSTTQSKHSENIQIDLLVHALSLADDGNYEQAEQCVLEHLKKNKLDPKAYFLLGLIKHAAGDEDSAEKHFNKTIFLDPHHHEALIYLSLISEKKGEKNQAMQFKKRSEK